MESTLQLEIVTPDKVVVSQTVDYVGVPGIEGEFGVLPHHIALLSAWLLATSISASTGRRSMCSSPAGSLRFPTTS